MMARELEALDNPAGLAGWMDINFSRIKQNCASSLALAECYRGSLVRSYCDKTGLSSQQVAAEIANILERDMNNKRIAQLLRQLDFSQSEFQCVLIKWVSIQLSQMQAAEGESLRKRCVILWTLSACVSYSNKLS